MRANDAIIHPTAENTKTDSVAEIGEVDAEVLRAIRNIRYGSVEITIHDSREGADRAQRKTPFRPYKQ
jgi:Uncharacterized small protein (DUF2292)